MVSETETLLQLSPHSTQRVSLHLTDRVTAVENLTNMQDMFIKNDMCHTLTCHFLQEIQVHFILGHGLSLQGQIVCSD